MLVLIFCGFVKGWKWGCLISHLFWTGRIREFWGLWIVHFDEDWGTIIFWHRKNSHDDNFCVAEADFSLGSNLTKHFYVVPPWHQEPVCSQAHVYGWPKLQIEKGYQIPIVDSLECACAALSLQLELAWFKSQRNQKREFHTFARDGEEKQICSTLILMKPEMSCCEKKNPFPKWMGIYIINGTSWTNSSHHLQIVFLRLIL